MSTVPRLQKKQPVLRTLHHGIVSRSGPAVFLFILNIIDDHIVAIVLAAIQDHFVPQFVILNRDNYDIPRALEGEFPQNGKLLFRAVFHRQNKCFKAHLFIFIRLHTASPFRQSADPYCIYCSKAAAGLQGFYVESPYLEGGSPC